MSKHGTQDFQFPPAHRSRGEEAEAQAPPELEHGGFEHRLAAILRRLRSDDTALVGYLQRLSPGDWRTARIVAIRELGAERANSLCGWAFGEAAPLATAVLEKPQEGAGGPSLEALFELARARGLAEVWGLLGPGGRHHDAGLAAEVLDRAERHVAMAAEALMRRPGPVVASGAIRTAVGSGPRPRKNGAAGGAQAMLHVADRRAASLFRQEREGHGVEPDPDHPAVHEALTRCGGGELLPEGARLEIEQRLGTDFSRVRIHRDDLADAAATALHARAFTVGDDIFFAAGAFDPSSVSGRALLVHELTHVAQAYEGRVPSAGSRSVSHPDDPLEREAQRQAEVPVPPRPVGAAHGANAAGPTSASTERAPGGGPTLWLRPKTTTAGPDRKIAAAVDRIIDALVWYTTDADSNAILAEFTGKKAAIVKAIIAELQARAPQHQQTKDGMVEWLLGDMAPTQRSKLRALLAAAGIAGARVALVTGMTFNGRTLSLDGDIPLTVLAVSGQRSKNPHNKTKKDQTVPSAQSTPDLGPLPAGSYSVSPSELETKGFNQQVWGPLRVRIRESTVTSVARQLLTDRTGGFFIHQDLQRDGTAGCIGLQSSSDVRKVFNRLKQTKSDIPLKVVYQSKVSVELKDAPAAELAEDRVTGWLRQRKQLIVAAEAQWHVDRRAIAGAIAWEALKNIRSGGPGSRFSGPGKVHYRENHFSEGDPASKQVEDRGMLPTRTEEERKGIVATDGGAITYIGAIMRAFADEARAGHYHLYNQPGLLATFYNAWKPDQAKAFFAKNKRPAPLAVNDTMGAWVRDNLPYIEQAVGKPPSALARPPSPLKPIEGGAAANGE